MSGRTRELRGYAIGYVVALVLTGVAFAAVVWHPLSARQTLAAIFALALVQLVVQFRFFLNISLARSSRHDLQLVLFASLIIALMVSGTLVILFNLHGRMMGG